MSFRTNSGITLKTNVDGHFEQRVEYGGEVLDGGNAVPYIRTVNANTGEELDRYFLINDAFLQYDGTKLVSSVPLSAPRAEFYSTADASPTLDNGPALIIGPRDGYHIEIDQNEILAKESATTGGVLYVGDPAGGKMTSIGGAPVDFRSTGAITSNTSLVIPNGYGYYIKNSSGTTWIVAGINSSNDCYYGYGSYTNSTGNATYYGNNVRIITKNKVTINNNPLFKTNTCSSPTATLNAGQGTTKTANITTISGYTPIGIIEATCNHGQICSMGAFWLSGNTANGSWTNRSSSSTSLYASFKILHIRSELL